MNHSRLSIEDCMRNAIAIVVAAVAFVLELTVPISLQTKSPPLRIVSLSLEMLAGDASSFIHRSSRELRL